MALELKTDINIPYVDTEDAFEIFETVVRNGQTRLALEVLVDVMVAVLNKVSELDDAVSEIVSFLSDDSEVETPVEEKVEAEVKQEETVKEEQPKVEAATPKQKAKKEDSEPKE